MNAITVDKLDLLEKLKANRNEHRKIFLEAQAGFRQAAIRELDSMLADARTPDKKIRRTVNLVEPVDQTKDYDRAIAMLEMSVDEKIQLEEHDFRAYVQDEWSWKAQFNNSNRMYSPSLAAMLDQEADRG